MRANWPGTITLVSGPRQRTALSFWASEGKEGIGAYHSAVPTPVIDPRLSTGWVSPERLQASPLRRTARSLLTSADEKDPLF